jgi:hypothetical protein
MSGCRNIGQLAAMFASVASRSWLPVRSLIGSDQNVPDPTSAGIASDPSNRTNEAFTRLSAKTRSSSDE